MNKQILKNFKNGYVFALNASLGEAKCLFTLHHSHEECEQNVDAIVSQLLAGQRALRRHEEHYC